MRLEGGQEVTARAVVLATGADYRRLPVPEIESYEGVSIFYAAGPQEAQRCGATRVGVVGGGNSAAQAAIWLARGGALVTLFHRRADLRETMSDYLIHDLERAGVVSPRTQRDRRPARRGRPAGGGDASRRRADSRSRISFSSSAPRRAPTGSAARSRSTTTASSSRAQRAGAEGILETSVPGVFAVGDVRSGSVKRCATAVGEGAMVVRFVHERFSRDVVEASPAVRS